MGKRDIWSEEQMAAERPDVRYRVFDLSAEAAADPALVGPMLQELSGALESGLLPPLPVSVFDMSCRGRRLPDDGPGPAHRQAGPAGPRTTW